jgi:hypothetical protein
MAKEDEEADHDYKSNDDDYDSNDSISVDYDSETEPWLSSQPLD